MPPRKRAQSAPKTDEETLEPVDEQTGPEVGAETEPERSDLQTVGLPCSDCFPGGWPEGSFAVGCEHGSWIRD